MQVRLTKEGQKALGFSLDRKIANVSDKRAFALMSNGFAAKDNGFMVLFSGPLPEKPEKKPEEKQEPKPEPKPEIKQKSKKETATLKPAMKREKAIKQ